MTVLLEVAGLRAGYGGSTILHGVDLTVALLGRNGAGKASPTRSPCSPRARSSTAPPPRSSAATPPLASRLLGV